MPSSQRQSDSEHLKAEPLVRGRHERLLYEFCCRNEDYFLSCENKQPTRRTAEAFFQSLPAGLKATDKLLFGAFEEAELTAFAELYKNRHRQGEWLIATLIVTRARRRQSLGKHWYLQLEKYMLQGGADMAFLGVDDTNQAGLQFWASLGYSDTGQCQRQERNGIIKTIRVFEKSLQG